jgi:DNA-binding transcriptional MerR regulator/effector-binding domain-containing protein
MLTGVAATANALRCEPGMYSIGEFSKISGLSIKTLRFYHDEGILVPSAIDPNSGYRYYDRHNADTARVIVALRDLEFSLAEIKEILARHEDESDILAHLERRKHELGELIRRHRGLMKSLDRIITQESEARQTMQNSKFEVEEKVLEIQLIAGVRMKGKYSDCGRGFAQIGRALGRFIAGKPFCLYYDGEYRPDDADLEAAFPVRRPKQETTGIAVRELPGGRCVSLLHKGPYDQLGRSYAKILDYVRAKKYDVQLPTREVYIKGPGMIFKGNPNKYLTEIQMLIG